MCERLPYVVAIFCAPTEATGEHLCILLQPTPPPPHLATYTPSPPPHLATPHLLPPNNGATYSYITLCSHCSNRLL